MSGEAKSDASPTEEVKPKATAKGYYLISLVHTKFVF